ncbi:MAG: methionyl-tRNA formyltransferase [Halieaceae bacterium]
MPTPLRLAFAGTPDFAARHLDRLMSGPHRLAAVLTQPDRPAGRGKRLQPSPVKSLAMEANLPVWQPDTLKTSEAEQVLAEFELDLLIVVAYGLILPANVLAIPALGCLNVHASLLPRWRGAAPVQRAIEAGDTETGVSIMAMEAGLDTGPILMSRRLNIRSDHTSGQLLSELATVGAEALADSLDQIETLIAKAAPQQDDCATYAHKIDKTEGDLNWYASAEELARRIRAFQPQPGCYTHLDDERIKILAATAETGGAGQPSGQILSADENGLRVSCGEGVLVITEAQLPGAKGQPIAALINGHRDLLRAGRQMTSLTRS